MPARQETFIFSKTARPVLAPTQPSGVSFLGGKVAGAKT